MTSGHRALRLTLCFAAAAALSLTATLPARAQAPSVASAQAAAGSAQPLPEDYIRAAPVQPGRAPGMKIQESSANQRVFEVRLTTGDEILSGLTDLALKNRITSAYITGIGGLSTGLLGWGDPSNGAFKKVPIDQKAELVSLVGDISMRDGRPYVHLHGVVAFSDGSTKGGHVLEANVAPVAEITVVALESGAEPPAH